MALLNSIGSFLFQDLRGNPGTYGQEAEPIQRRGVDGTAIKVIGKRGDTFTMESVVDLGLATAQQPLLNGRNTLYDYRNLIGTGEHSMVWQGTAIGNVAVLEVRQVSLTAASCVVGGINVPHGFPGCILVASWNLVIIDIPAP